MNSALFIVLVAATIGLALWQLSTAVLKPERLVGLPVIAALAWLYFYGFMAWRAASDLALYIPVWALEIGQGVALLGLASLLLGWHAAVRRGARDTVQAGSAGRYGMRRLWWMGMVVILVGSSAHYLFINQAEIDWQGTSAYWYLLFHIVYPGIALCVVAWSKGAVRTTAERLLFLGLVAFAMFPHLYTARRGPLFPFIIVMVFLPAVLRRVAPSRALLLGSLAGTGLAMLLFVAVRPWIYSEQTATVRSVSAASWAEALSSLSADEVFVERARKLTDNEYGYHCGVIATNVELASYQYGTGYLTLLTHWIPRAWWPEKPALGEGWFGNVLEQVPLVMGWSMSAGASAGGVAEVFNQFGWASPLFWLLIGAGAGLLFRKSQQIEDPRWALAYVGVLAAAHWLISQGFAAAFVPACIYQGVLFVALRLARADTRRSTAAPRSLGHASSR